MNTTLLGVAGVAGLCLLAYAVFRFLAAKQEALGKAEARAKAAEETLARLKKQGEIIAEQKEPEDVAKDLDAGKF
jgi:hypothetical protein